MTTFTDILTTAAAAAAAAAASAAASGGGGVGSFAGSVPRGVPQPGACMHVPLYCYIKFIIQIFPAKLIKIFPLLVGGGTPFSPGTPPVGAESIAAGLVPQGLTPIAFFPATAIQTMPAVSVIFAESLLVGKRKKRSAWRYGNHGSNVTAYEQII